MASATYIARAQRTRELFRPHGGRRLEATDVRRAAGRIRATVRAGRDTMRETLLSWLPDDLRGARVLDAGCGTGAMAVSSRGAAPNVLAIDISPTLIELAQRAGSTRTLPRARSFVVGDMLDPLTGGSTMSWRWTA